MSRACTACAGGGGVTDLCDHACHIAREPNPGPCTTVTLPVSCLPSHDALKDLFVFSGMRYITMGTRCVGQGYHLMQI